jgi:hypothetical protein
VARIKFKGKGAESRSRQLRPSLPFSKGAIDGLTDAQAYVLLGKIWSGAQREMRREFAMDGEALRTIEAFGALVKRRT